MKLPAAFVKESENIHVVVECTRGSHHKINYDPASEMFKLSEIFPAGVVFPFEFGFVPHTKADDGDPFDVILLADDPLFTGCLAEARLIGVIEAEQTDEGKRIRNDRAIAVAVESKQYKSIKTMDELDKNFVDDMVDFIAAYQKRSEHHFTPLRFSGPERAVELIKETIWSPFFV
ncbi:MAG: inorganic diphosphatase [Williamsia sp.]|nr:inorganic diphosphatase [Williamsia sp.]